MEVDAPYQFDAESLLDVISQKTIVDLFTPNPGGEEAFFDDITHHEICLAGGNDSGKSFSGMMRAAWHHVAEVDEEGKLTGKTIHPKMDLMIPTYGVEGFMSSYSQDVQNTTLQPIFEKIMGPYCIERDTRDGIMYSASFKGIDSRYPSRFHCKWITQGINAYKGAKVNWIFMDEPHPEGIYNEAFFRLTQSGGYLWICMTPIVGDDETELSAKDVIWYRDKKVEPWERDPSKLPLFTVIYIDVEENAAHVGNIDHVMMMLQSVSEIERKIRKSGSFLVFTGRNAFDRQMLLDLKLYLQENIDEATPLYGDLIYDNMEKEGSKIRFIESDIAYFPDKPQGEYVLKIWEKPVKSDNNLQKCPRYLISADVAKGVSGGDYTSVYVFRRDNRRIVAGIHGHIAEDSLARLLWNLGHYYNDGESPWTPAWMVIETRAGGGFGALTLTYLLVGYKDIDIKKYPSGRIFHRPTEDNMRRGLRTAHSPGWDTTKSSRKYVIGGMHRGISEAYKSIKENKLCTIPDWACIDEAMGFVKNKQDIYEGYPDDRLFALGIGNHVMDMMDRGEYVEQQSKQEDDKFEDDMWKVGRNGRNVYPVLNYNHIKKLLRTPKETLLQRFRI